MKVLFLYKSQFVFSFPFSWELKDKVKGLYKDRMQYNKLVAYPNHWSVPISVVTKSQENIETLFSFCQKNGFTIASETTEYLSSYLETSEKLKSLSNSIESDFEVSGLLLTPRPYQKAGIQYMVKAKAALNSDEMRLGKSLQSLAAVHHLDAYPCLVLCKSGLMYNWRNEIIKTLGEKDIHIWESISDIPEKGKDFVILNPEKLSISSYLKDDDGEYILDSAGRKIKDKLKLQDTLLKYKFKSIIYDEIHNIGSSESVKFKVIKKIGGSVKVKFGLSGSPIKNRALEICNILAFLGKLSQFGGKWGLINEFYKTTPNGFGVDIGEAKDLEVLHNRLKSTCMLRRTRMDVFGEIPQKDFISIEVPISNRKDYERLTGELRTFKTKSKNLTYAEEKKGTIFELRKILGVGKIEAMGDWVDDFLSSGEPLIIFAHHIAVQHALLARFPFAARIIAEDSLQVREQNRLRFQNKQTNLIICSLNVAGEGQDLSVANAMAICELGWTPVQMNQAIARMEAIGKDTPTTVYTFLGANTIDIKMASLLQFKASESDMVVSGKVSENSYAETLLENL